MKRTKQLRLGKLLLFLVAVMSTIISNGQTVVKGKVIDAKGAAVSGASVTLSKSKLGASTNASGEYEISNVKTGNYVLSVTAVGFNRADKSISVANGATSVEINVELEEKTNSLDEVVVTGNLGKTTKKQLGNAVTTIKASQLQNTGTSNLSAMLSGKVMGAQVNQNSGDPAGGISIKLRGVGTAFGSSEPLYMVDGIIVDNSSANVINLNGDAQGSRIQAGTNRIADINPNDIERIEVINGAAAAAIYGSRASNGIVQIFTKKGKMGKAKITFSTSIQQSAIRNKWEMNDVGQRFGIATGPRLNVAADRLTTVGNVTGTVGTGPTGLSGKLLESKYNVTRYDYQDDIFRKAIGTDNHISVSGASDKFNYYFSGSYLKNEGIINGTNYQRYGFKARTEATLSKWAKLSGGLTYTNSRSKDLPNGNNFFNPISTITISDNVWNINERDANGNLQNVEFARVNPLTPVETFDIRQEVNRGIADVRLSLTPIKGLNIEFTNGFDNYAQQGTTYQARMPYAAFGSVAAAFFPDGYVSNAKLNYFQWSTDAVATYRTDILKNLNSSTSVGFAAQYIKNSYTAQEGRDLLPVIKTISAAQNLFSIPVDNRTEQSVYGYFLQQTFGFKNKLFATFAGRFDGSSAFGKDARAIFYPKASLSYNISDEKFWKDGKISKWFNALKLRTAYGKAGNLTGVGAYDRFTTYTPIIYTAGGFSPSARAGNPNIRPEIKTENEFGVDMQFFNGRAGVQFTAYNQKITDLLLPFNVAPSTGASAILDNVGVMTNKGLEMMVSGAPIDGKDFKWNSSILYGRNKNKITEVYKNATFIGFDQSNTQGLLVGEPVGVYYVNYYARNPDGSLLLKNDAGFNLPQIERGDIATNTPQRDPITGQPIGGNLRKVLGDPNPDFNLTFNNEFSYKNWNFRFQIDGVYGFEVYNWDWITRNNVGHGPWAKEELLGTRTRGWTAAVGGFNGPRIQEEHVEDGSFTKLREVSIGYTLNRIKFAESIRFSLTGRNLISWDKYRGFDPEVNSAGQSFVRGTDFGSIPIPKVYQFSLLVNF
jgi:TonB-linked SusC/RagA family outer membrane protein